MSDPFLEEIAKSALSVLNPSRHRSYARAFKDALTLDTDVETRERNFPDVVRANDIATQYTFDKPQQRKLGLGWSQSVAVQYLGGFVVLSDASFRRRYSSITYFEKYKIAATMLSEESRILHLTPAEWLHFCDQSAQPALPECLRPFMG